MRCIVRAFRDLTELSLKTNLRSISVNIANRSLQLQFILASMLIKLRPRQWIDDRDKTASFVGNAFPRRSLSLIVRCGAREILAKNPQRDTSATA